MTLAFLCEKLSKRYIYKDLTGKIKFLEGYYWFKLTNLKLALGVAFKF